MSQANSKTAPQWLRIPFAKALSDNTAGQPKVFRRDYLGRGALAVVDQGATTIAGYTDDWSMAYRGTLPVILFGDHTRHVKYVDFPFALGADGVKALEPTPAHVAKFLYYYLVATDIPQRGYSRHFQFLREIQCPLAALSEQRRIVEILDQADRLRRLRAEADAKADRILPALLTKALGPVSTWDSDPRSQPLGELVDFVSGGTPSKKSERLWSGEIPWVSPKDMKEDFIQDTQDHVSRDALDEASLQTVQAENVLLVVRGMILARTVPVGLNLRPVTINQDMKALVPKGGNVTGRYLWAALYHARTRLITLVRTAGHGTRKLDTPDLLNLPIVVPSAEQRRLVEDVVRARQTDLENRSRARLRVTRLFSNLLDQAFSGELTASWREAHMKDLLQEMEHQAKALAATARLE
jgi:type I restriction enzyme S subunit